MRPSDSLITCSTILLAACTPAVPPADHRDPPSASSERGHDERRSITVQVGAAGYAPSEVAAAAGEEVRLVFRRTSEEGCGQQLVFPSLGIRRDLPLDEPVTVDITMPSTGIVAFTCGMGMYRGSVVVR